MCKYIVIVHRGSASSCMLVLLVNRIYREGRLTKSKRYIRFLIQKKEKTNGVLCSALCDCAAL